MPVGHGVYDSPESERPVFQEVAPGMTVIVKHGYLTGEWQDCDWWIGQAIHCGGAARDSKVSNLFQIFYFDLGGVRWVNADLVNRIFA